MAKRGEKSQRKKQPAPQAATRRAGWPGMAWLVLAAIVLGAGAFAGVYRAVRQPSPLGVPLPPVPRIFTFIDQNSQRGAKIEKEDMSVLQHRIVEGWLENLAPQPDGVPPLRYPCHSDRLDFDIVHPPLSETIVYPGDEFAKDGVDMEVLIRADQPLLDIKYSVPFKHEGETVADFTARTRSELEQAGARFLPGIQPLESQGYRFERLEYIRQHPSGKDLAHLVFFGPAGARVLCIDFQAKPENQQLAWVQALKVMGSFKPGPALLALAQAEAPAASAGAGAK